MTRWIPRVMVIAIMMGLAGTVQAKDKPKWHTVAELTADGEAKEVSVGREARTVRISNTSGNVIVNTVVLRNGGEKDIRTVAAKIPEGQSIEIAVGEKARMVTGLRISDSGGGKYKVEIR